MIPSIKSPYYMFHHPIFRLDARRVRWAWSPQRLSSYTFRLFLLMLLVVFGVWFLLLLFHMLFGIGLTFDDHLAYRSSVDGVALIFVALNAGVLLLDFLSINAAVRSINGEIETGRWDLLRLTALNGQGIVAAKHAGLRLRMWRLTVLVAGGRLGSIILLLFTIFVLPYLVTGSNISMESFLLTFRDEPVATFVALLTGGLVALVYVIEPFWRMQTMTALGMMLSAYILHVPMATLAGLGSMLAVWLLQALVFVALVVGIGFGLGAVMVPFVYTGNSPIIGALFILVACIISAGTVYGFYSILQTWGLRRVLHRLAKND